MMGGLLLIPPHCCALPCSQFHAMDTLQRNGYDLAKAMSTLVPQGGPVLCRDEMEEWSASEAMLFEEALEKYGKDFNDIRQDFVSWGGGDGMGGAQGEGQPPVRGLTPLLSLQLPWKSLASIVQFYYMWKTTDRYIQQVRCGVGCCGLWGPVVLPPQCDPCLHLTHLCLQKRLKAAEADSKLKQVYIPT